MIKIPSFKREKISPEQEEQDELDIDNEEDSLSDANKKNRFILIAAISAVLSIVVYFLFFTGGDQIVDPNANLPTDVTKPSAIEPGESPFDIGQINDLVSSEEDSILSKPDLPEIPELPEFDTQDLLENLPPSVQDVQESQNPPVQNVDDIQLPSILPNAPTIRPGITVNKDDKKEDNIDLSITKNENQVDPRTSPIIVMSGGGGPSVGVGYENNIINLTEDPILELTENPQNVQATKIKDPSVMIVQGKIIDAVLETAINTEVPGNVRGIVSRDVYGEAGNNILIPRGSRLFGSYSTEIDRGQGRVQIIWSRLIRPDGVDVAIGFNASDNFGRSGVEGIVDNRYASILANSTLISLLTIGLASVADEASGSETVSTTDNTLGAVTVTGRPTDEVIRKVGQGLADVGTRVVEDLVDLRPLIRIPQGTKITVLANQDLILPPVKKSRSGR